MKKILLSCACILAVACSSIDEQNESQSSLIQTNAIQSAGVTPNRDPGDHLDGIDARDRMRERAERERREAQGPTSEKTCEGLQCIFKVQPGAKITLFEGINVKGYLAIRIVDETGNGCANFWWITKGFNRDIGRKCGQFIVPYNVTVPSKLRAGDFNKDSVLFAKELSAELSIDKVYDNSWSRNWDRFRQKWSGCGTNIDCWKG